MYDRSNDEGQKGNIRLLLERISKAILKKMSFIERAD